MTFKTIYVGKCSRCGGNRHGGLCDFEIKENEERAKLPVVMSPALWLRLKEDMIGRFGEKLGCWLAQRVGNKMRGKDCIRCFAITELPTEKHPMTDHTSIVAYQRKRLLVDGSSFEEILDHNYSGRKFVFGFTHGDYP